MGEAVAIGLGKAVVVEVGRAVDVEVGRAVVVGVGNSHPLNAIGAYMRFAVSASEMPSPSVSGFWRSNPNSRSRPLGTPSLSSSWK